MKALVVKSNGEVNVIDQEWTYEQINKAVGGWIEAINFGEQSDHFAYINEEGKLLDLPTNELVTSYWYNSGTRILIGDFISGDAVIFGEVDDEGENTEVPQHVIDAFIKMKEKVYG